MKLKSFCLLILMIPLFANSQMRVSDGSEENYSQPKVKISYSVYMKLKDLEKNDSSVLDKGLIKRLEFYKGLLKKEIEDNVSYEYFYKGTNIIQCFVKYSSNKIAEVYYYNYDKITNKRIRTVGYAGKKLIYKITVNKNKDTLITKRFFNGHNDIEKVIVSNNGLEKVSVQISGQNFWYSKTKYNSKKQIILEIDSNEYNSNRKIYNYDSIGRIKEIRFMDSVLNGFKIYNYNLNETIISTFTFYYGSHQTQQLIDELQTLRYDDLGNLIYEEIKKYGRGEGKIGEEDIGSSEIEEIIEKYYKNNLLQKVSRNLGDREYLYDFKYD